MKFATSLPFWGAWALVLVVASCGDSAPAESAELAEAKAVHEAIISQSDSLQEVIAGRLGEVSDSLAYAQVAGDSAAIERWTTRGQQLNTIDLQFHDWMHTMVEIPGHAHDHAHDHGDGEDGHAGHDHSHDHAAEAALEGLSDAEILEIQKELQARLSAIEAELNGLGD